MNFYQQNYFKPYHQLVLSPQKYHQQKFRTPSTSKYQLPSRINYEGKYNIEPVWEYLYNEGIKNQKQLLEKHELSKHKIDVQCTFQPMIKHNKRYLVPSNSTFLERNTLWMENKIQKIVKQKEEEINKGLKQCTFTPHLNSKSKNASSHQYRNVIHKKNCPTEKLHKSVIKTQTNAIEQLPKDYSASEKKTYVGIEKAKQMIKNELKRLVL